MRFALLLWISIVAVSGVAHAQGSAPLKDRITGILSRMATNDMPTSNAALDEMMGLASSEGGLAAFLNRHPEEADRVKLALINLLDAHRKGGWTYPPSYPPEEITGHYEQLIDVVSCLDDERAIPSLVAVMRSTGGACNGLLRFGLKALGPVLNELRNPDPTMRMRALGVGIRILRMDNSADSKAQILSLIRAAIVDPEFLLRSNALYAIENLSDEKGFSQALQEFVPALEKISQSDPFIVPGLVPIFDTTS